MRNEPEVRTVRCLQTVKIGNKTCKVRYSSRTHTTPKHEWKGYQVAVVRKSAADLDKLHAAVGVTIKREDGYKGKWQVRTFGTKHVRTLLLGCKTGYDAFLEFEKRIGMAWLLEHIKRDSS